MAFWNTLIRIVTMHIPPSMWRLWKGGRLSRRAQNNADRRGVDVDYFIWESAMTASVMLAFFFGLLSFGLVPAVGQGFAKAEEQKIVARQVVDTRIEQLEWRMFDLKVRQCAAIKVGESAQVFTIQLNDLLKKYKDITGFYPTNIPACNEL